MVALGRRAEVQVADAAGEGVGVPPGTDEQALAAPGALVAPLLAHGREVVDGADEAVVPAGAVEDGHADLAVPAAEAEGVLLGAAEVALEVRRQRPEDVLGEVAPGQEPEPLVALVAPQLRRRLARLRPGPPQPAARIRGPGAEEPLHPPPGTGHALDGRRGDAHPRDVHRLQGRGAGHRQLPGLPGGVGGAEDAEAPVRPRQGGGPQRGVVAVRTVHRGAAHLVHRLVGAVRGVAPAHVLGDGDVAGAGDPLQGALLVRRPGQEHGEGLARVARQRGDHVRPQHRAVAHRRRDVQLDADVVGRLRGPALALPVRPTGRGRRRGRRRGRHRGSRAGRPSRTVRSAGAYQPWGA